MPELFCIQTERASIRWSGPLRARDAAVDRSETGGAMDGEARGMLRIHARRRGLVLEEGSRRFGLPPELCMQLDASAGPPLFEETNYDVLVQGSPDVHVSLRHRDPGIVANLGISGAPSLLHGSVNFRGQIGESRFTLLVDEEPELDFTVEVFPSKITYREDYAQMIARVQDLATGLALEYLRATYHLGAATGAGKNSRLEWVALLRHLVEDLERALRHVASRPIRGLVRKTRMMRIDQLRRADHALRQAILRDRGRGVRQRLRSGTPVRSRLPEHRAQSTLDTPEHRWLAMQLTRARRRLASILEEEESRLRNSRFIPSPTDKHGVAELKRLESRVAALQRLEPLEAAQAPPPSGFTSLKLQGAPGYQEAFRSLTILQQGLRIGGGPVELSLKDLHLLYEYWCFLEVVQLVATLVKHPIPAGALVELRAEGLRIRLEQGRAQTVPFSLPEGRSLEVTYNPTFESQDVLLPQRPDIVLTFRDPKWPTVRLVLDAKYRLQEDEEFIDRFGTPGPPRDAVNVLHRYRDAILEAEGEWGGNGSAESAQRGKKSAEPPGRWRGTARSGATRTVIEGAALFPLDGLAAQGFQKSRFWESLERLGIGALPFLPGSTEHVETWLRSVLTRSGWQTAERVVGYEIQDKAADWSQAAEETVLVGVLRNQQAAKHLDWIHAARTYYTPLTPSQARQMTARWVALYSPAPIREKGASGAVAHVARVESIEVREREAIPTPWPSGRSPKGLQVVYRLGPLEPLAEPVENRGLNGEGGGRFSQNRWTSRLALDRSSEVTELLLESRTEWILYESLRAQGRPFQLRVDRAPAAEPGKEGRVWFQLEDRKVRWAGEKGWEIRKDGRRWFASEAPAQEATADQSNVSPA